MRLIFRTLGTQMNMIVGGVSCRAQKPSKTIGWSILSAETNHINPYQSFVGLPGITNFWQKKPTCFASVTSLTALDRSPVFLVDLPQLPPISLHSGQGQVP